MRKLLSILLLLAAMNAAAQVDYERHVFKGKLGGKIAVEIAFQQAMNNGDG